LPIRFLIIFHLWSVALPDIPIVITLSPADGDDTERIQQAIDQVEEMTPNADGIRGAVLLRSGCYDVEGQLFIEKSGVVLRGEGQTLDGTILHAHLQEKHDFITLKGQGSGFDRRSSSRQDIPTSYVPLGSYSFAIDNASDYALCDTIALRRTPNQF
jgi:pectin methylesterase-like acyl-CoA thioesterase